MNAIIQHTFNSGLGDCVICVTEYLNHGRKLKELGYNLHLKVNVTQNKYYKTINLFDLFDSTLFDIFTSIEYIDSSFKSIDGYVINYITYNTIAGSHWWDLFLDTECELSVERFLQRGTVFRNQYKPSWNVTFNKAVYDMYDDINLTEFDAIYLRTKDADETLSFYEQYERKIKDVYSTDKQVFVCSNSFAVKNKLKQNNQTLTVDIPGESKVGNHFGSQRRKFDEETNKQRTLLSLLDMLILSRANRIYFASHYARISNFLFYPFAHSVPIEYWSA